DHRGRLAAQREIHHLRPPAHSGRVAPAQHEWPARVRAPQQSEDRKETPAPRGV
ncbi:uncharacterized protein METZ01_LOCUS388306, partial [marine metagenome]